MSKLEREDFINCFHCGTRLYELLLCINRCENNQRCPSLVCAECEYCYGCYHRIQELKNELKKNRFGRKDENTEVCKIFLNKLRDDHGITEDYLKYLQKAQT